jgi:hypothetical protein
VKKHLTKDYTMSHLARDLGVPQSVVAGWRNGNWPDIRYVLQVAEILGDDGIEAAAAAQRTKRCPDLRCRRQFVATRHFQRYCSSRCSVRSKRARASEQNRQIMVVEINNLKNTIDRMCRSCEPAQVCRQPECPIQKSGFSPFPIEWRQPRNAPVVSTPKLRKVV